MMKPLRILLADDDKAMCNGLTDLLNRQDDLEIVAIAHDGREAIELSGKTLFDVALLDVNMPNGDGIETAAYIARTRPSATIIMLTAFENQQSLGKALALGVKGFITKDTPAAELTQLIKHAHQGKTVLDQRPLDIITRSYTSSTQSLEEYQEFNDRVSTLPKHLRSVFNELLEAKSNKDISETLHLSASTVRSYVSDILTHTGTTTRAHLAVTAIKAQTPIFKDAH